MPICVVETVQLERHGLPVLVILAAKAFQADHCRGEVFIIPGTASDDLPFGRSVAVGRDPVDEDLAIAIAREIAREELIRRLQALPPDEQAGSVDFAPVDAGQIRALRCLGKYSQLGGIPARSYGCDSEIRAFVQSVGAAYTQVHMV